MLNRIVRKLIPREIYKSLSNYRILSIDFGQLRTINRWECIDNQNNPIPWYSYPAIEYIKQLDFSDKIIFEYGSGNSTIFWAGRCKNLVSIEDNQEWFDKIKSKLPGNVEYKHLPNKEDYIKSIAAYPYNFDIVIIDGIYRYECALEALNKMAGTGIIILDNSEQEEETSGLLRKSDLLEIDMSGFGPINGYTWTTSFYLSRKVKLLPAHEHQPMPGVGSPHRSR